MQQSPAETLAELITAQCPLIYAITHEEERVLEAVTGESGRRKMHAYVWSFGRGWVSLLDGKAGMGGDKALKPQDAIAWATNRREPGLYVLLDLHPYFKDPTVVRALRDGCAKTPFVLVSPTLELPVEVEKLAVVIDWPLPDRLELARGIGLKAIAGKDMLVLDAMAGLTLTEARVAYGRATARGRGTADPAVVVEEKQQIIRKSGLLEYVSSGVTAADVGGLGAFKAWLRKRAAATTPEAREFGLPTPKGVFLAGISGGGKSLAAKASAQIMNRPLLQLDLGKVFAGLVGSSEGNMRRALKTVEAVAPCVLLVDEADKSMQGTASSGQTDGGTTSRVIGTFLTWMQERKADVFVVMTANAVDRLPPEMLRAGRFDAIFFVDLPTLTEREAILKIHLRKVGRDPDTFNVEAIARAAEDYTGADIELAIRDALYEAFDQGWKLNTQHVIDALKQLKPFAQVSPDAVASIRDWAKDRARRAAQDETTPVVVPTNGEVN